jgi:hypothetical protein
MKTRKPRRLTKRQQAKVLKWMYDAENMGFAKLTHRLTPEQFEQRKAVIEDALIAAVLDYDSSKGASFSTYLFRKVRWAIIDAGRPRKSKVGQARTFTDVMAEE